jgi:hypothetical protein
MGEREQYVQKEDMSTKGETQHLTLPARADMPRADI